jgi:hypothetical protein
MFLYAMNHKERSLRISNMLPCNNSVFYRQWTLRRRREFLSVWIVLPLLLELARAALGRSSGVPEPVFWFAVVVVTAYQSFAEAAHAVQARALLLPLRVAPATYVWGIFWSAVLARSVEFCLWLPALQGWRFSVDDVWFPTLLGIAWLSSWAGLLVGALAPGGARGLGLSVLLLYGLVGAGDPFWTPLISLMGGSGCGQWIFALWFHTGVNLIVGTALLGLGWFTLRS